jgi:hypothetical protein
MLFVPVKGWGFKVFHRLQVGWDYSPLMNPDTGRLRRFDTMINPDDFGVWVRLWGNRGLLVWWDRTGRGLGN